MALSCYLLYWSVQTALFVLLAAATGALLVVANLDGRHHGLRTSQSLATLRQKVGMQDVFEATFSLASIRAVAVILTP